MNQQLCCQRSSHPVVICGKAIYKDSAIFTGKSLCWSLFLIKLQTCNFIEKSIRHKYFTVNITKFLSTAFLQNTSLSCFCLYYCQCFPTLVLLVYFIDSFAIVSIFQLFVLYCFRQSLFYIELICFIQFCTEKPC